MGHVIVPKTSTTIKIGDYVKDSLGRVFQVKGFLATGSVAANLSDCVVVEAPMQSTLITASAAGDTVIWGN